MNAPASREEREHLDAMLLFEKRAVLPLKWLMLGVSLYFLLLSSQPYWFLPEVEPFMLFLVYFFFNVAQSYFFYVSRVELSQVRAFVLVSYAFDLAFVAGLIYLDGQHEFGREMHGDLYVLYFLIVLRGTAIFRSASGKLLLNILLSAVFVLSLWQTFGRPDYDIGRQKEFALKLALIWMVMLVSWFIMDMLATQAERLARARERMARSENLATVGALAAGVAHEINNPIGIIQANCEYLLRLLKPQSEAREEIEAILAEARRVQGIVAQMIDLSKPKAEALAECDAKALAEEMRSFVFSRRSLGEIKTPMRCEEPPPMLWADANQIKQALLNLYLNAAQAVGETGTVETRIRRRDGGERVEIAILDSGPGIEDEALRRAFDPFFTTRADGTGLGLAVTRRIVEDHGGEIELERRPEGGTAARLVLPAAPR